MNRYVRHAHMCSHTHTVLHSGADIQQVKREDAGAVLADTLRQFLFDLQVEDGLEAVGYSKDDIPALVKGTIPQVCSGSQEKLQLFMSLNAAH